ncbi:MAG TPA: hypothetical protein PKN50_05490 [Spirochaetota bacterium]|nr:hypothetical protein [Spirochaetota bacterium]HPV39718.1 hypothetical protein [Spirochaetota bacterium]
MRCSAGAAILRKEGFSWVAHLFRAVASSESVHCVEKKFVECHVSAVWGYVHEKEPSCSCAVCGASKEKIFKLNDPVFFQRALNGPVR